MSRFQRRSRRVDAPLAQLRTATLRGLTVYPPASQRDVFYVVDPVGSVARGRQAGEYWSLWGIIAVEITLGNALFVAKRQSASLSPRKPKRKRRNNRLRMRKKTHGEPARPRLLVLVDESNIGSSVRTAGRGLDWLKLRDFLAGPDTGRDLIEMVVYAGLPPAIPAWQDERDKKNKFVQWLRANGFMVVTKDGSPAEEGRYKANVDVMMAIDALELSVEMRPDVVILVTGDADFAYLATKLRRRGIRVEVASVAQNLGNMLRSTASEVIDLAELFRSFEMKTVQDSATHAVREPQKPASPPHTRHRRPRFRQP